MGWPLALASGVTAGGGAGGGGSGIKSVVVAVELAVGTGTGSVGSGAAMGSDSASEPLRKAKIPHQSKIAMTNTETNPTAA